MKFIIERLKHLPGQHNQAKHGRGGSGGGGSSGPVLAGPAGTRQESEQGKAYKKAFSDARARGLAIGDAREAGKQAFVDKNNEIIAAGGKGLPIRNPPKGVTPPQPPPKPPKLPKAPKVKLPETPKVPATKPVVAQAGKSAIEIKTARELADEIVAASVANPSATGPATPTNVLRKASLRLQVLEYEKGLQVAGNNPNGKYKSVLEYDAAIATAKLNLQNARNDVAQAKTGAKSDADFYFDVLGKLQHSNPKPVSVNIDPLLLGSKSDTNLTSAQLTELATKVFGMYKNIPGSLPHKVEFIDTSKSPHQMGDRAHYAGYDVVNGTITHKVYLSQNGGMMGVSVATHELLHATQQIAAGTKKYPRVAGDKRTWVQENEGYKVINAWVAKRIQGETPVDLNNIQINGTSGGFSTRNREIGYVDAVDKTYTLKLYRNTANRNSLTVKDAELNTSWAFSEVLTMAFTDLRDARNRRDKELLEVAITAIQESNRQTYD